MFKRKKRSEDEEISYWQSYSDMMAAIMLMFALILTVSMLESKKTIESERLELEAQQQELSEQRQQIESQKLVMESQEQQLAEKESQYAEQQLIMDSQQKELAEKESQYAEQQTILESQRDVLQTQQDQIEKLVGIRSELVEALRLEFEEANLMVSVDPRTGNITFDSDLLFEINDYKLTDESKQFLDEFFPHYFSVLSDERFADYIAEIIIEGHTAISHSWLASLELSQERAYQVVSYILKDDSSIIPAEKLDDFRKIITANGKSYSDPVYLADGTVDMVASRRVELKFRLKDEEMIDEMNQILEGNLNSTE